MYPSSLADGLLARTHLFPCRHSPPDSDDTDYWQLTGNRRWQARKATEPPKMRIISMAGEEPFTDALSTMITDTGRG